MKEQIFSTAQIKDLIIGLSAMIGMILGIYNLYRAVKKDKVSLKIIPQAVIQETQNTQTGGKGFILAHNHFSKTHSLFAFEIINKSAFPVVIDEIGFTIRSKKNRLAILMPQLGDKGEWPRELLPRKSVIVYGKLDSILDSAREHNITSAYVKTTCDSISYGNSIALKLLKKYAKQNT